MGTEQNWIFGMLIEQNENRMAREQNRIDENMVE
jgi:hypothetical protein